jgi:transcriptional regulator GlxA family with amidase domain
MKQHDKTFRVGVLALEGALLGSTTLVQEMLLIANVRSAFHGARNNAPFETHIFTPRRERCMRSATGTMIQDLTDDSVEFDLVFVPSVIHATPEDLLGRIPDIQPESSYLKKAIRSRVRVAFTCCSSFLFAHTGLLDGRKVTSSWWLASAFQQLYPQIQLHTQSTQIHDGLVSSLGTCAAAQEFVLELIREEVSDGIADQVRRAMALNNETHVQAPYLSQTIVQHQRDSISDKARRYVLKHLSEDISIAQLSVHCGTTERSLLRHFRAKFNLTPREYVQRLRIERARSLLESTQMTLVEISKRCGYLDPTSFRKLFKRETALTPGKYRVQFDLKASA